MRLTFGDMTKEVNVFNLGSQAYDMDDQSFKVNIIGNLTSEYNEEIELEAECDNKLGSDNLTLMRLSILQSSGHRAQVHFIQRQQAWLLHLLSHHFLRTQNLT